jgi:hypothetical protein
VEEEEEGFYIYPLLNTRNKKEKLGGDSYVMFMKYFGNL